MKFSYNWIKELSGTKKTVEEVSDLFLTHSFEVEGIEDLAKGLNGVVVGEVLSVEKHPDADRLNVARVDVGNIGSNEVPPFPSKLSASLPTPPPPRGTTSTILQIVCGAPNLEVGQKVPVALVGAKLVAKDKNGEEKEFVIKKGKIRGVESNGMICAEDELGLGADHEGIMVLGTAKQSRNDAERTQTDVEELVVGQNFAEYMNLDDKVLDIDILPNRGGDCLGYNGIAQELAALENFQFSIFNFQSIFNDLISKFKNNDDLDVKIDTQNCSRYMGIKIEGIKLAPSPIWMQARLRASGIKSINNIVDITNYVMLETGQPLHAFDVESVSSQKSDPKSRKSKVES